ncbi:twin-arginine translocase TatA/TatE family subunit [Streptomyces parvulus]|uniref:twin-arginine translocase TatA/TatE family subunit n=1 Tax=Streptomyces parvulus TaxID=146923 RepID=UPI0033B1BD9F
MFGLSELAVVLIVVAVVVAARKLPELTRSAGRSARILKSEARAMKDEERTPPGEPAAPRIIQGETVDRGDGGAGATPRG